jgi:hypothetical protein
MRYGQPGIDRTVQTYASQGFGGALEIVTPDSNKIQFEMV